MTRPILDMTAGSRMFWWDKENPLATFVDNRSETITVPDISSKGGQRVIEIKPDIIGDWTKELPFPNESFHLVVFDPPHMISAGEKSWLRAKYGVLQDTWQTDIAIGFQEAMRLLKPWGTLVFKWSDDQIKLGQVLKCIDYKPLFGEKRGKTHWLIFMKDGGHDE